MVLTSQGGNKTLNCILTDEESLQEPLSFSMFRCLQSLGLSGFSSFTRSQLLTHQTFDKPGNGAMEMLSRRTMQIGPNLQGDTVKRL